MCGCSKKEMVKTASGARVPAPEYRVVLNGGEGRTVFKTQNPKQARIVRRNYEGSIIDPDPGPDPDAPAAADGEPVAATEATEAAPSGDDTA
jgi:hypothetical protein